MTNVEETWEEAEGPLLIVLKAHGRDLEDIVKDTVRYWEK